MEEFEINLSDDKVARVIGKKKRHKRNPFPNSFYSNKDLIVYTVILEDHEKKPREIQVYTTLNGDWIMDDEENETTFQIKIAIEEYEYRKSWLVKSNR